MVALNPQVVAKLLRGEKLGYAALIFGVAAAVAFGGLIIGGIVAKNALLQTLAWAIGPALIAIGTAVAAFCYFKFNRELERQINAYVVDVFVENAAKLHHDRPSLTYTISLYEDKIEVMANDYKKDAITLDFSAMGKLGLGKKNMLCNAVTNRLCITFLKLLEHGAEYKNVNYVQKYISKNRTGKRAGIINDGEPDKAALKIYRKR